MNSAADWYAEQEYRERCGMPHEGESMPKQKISNADKIRQMTDEELCDFMAESICDSVDICRNNTPCRECRLAWLKQEAKDDAEAKP